MPDLKEEIEKRLIEKVCEHDLLYAVDAADYRDRHMRAMAWSNIGRDLGLPASTCKDMWRKLRNCYLNAINRRQNKNIPKWKHEDEMSFLLPFIEIRPPNIENGNSGEAIDPSGLYNGDNLESDIVIEDPEDSSEMILPETPNMAANKNEQPDDYYTPHPKRMKPMSERSTRTPHGGASGSSRVLSCSPGGGKDEVEMFFLSISETVKRLPAVDQARIKMELCKLVYEAEIRALEAAQYDETL